MFLKNQKNILLLIAALMLSSGWVLAQPVLTFSPVNGATGVAENTTITISSDVALRRDSDNANLNDGNVASVITLRQDNAFGTPIPFTATINGGDDFITITPSSLLPSSQVIYVAIGNVEATDGTNLANDPTAITFTTGDTQAPTISFVPTDGATNISISTNITITFNEAVRNIDNSAITVANVASLITLKETDGAGADVPFLASINGGKTQITIDPTGSLSNNQVYYVSIAPVEDANDNATSATSMTFTTTNDTQAPVPTFNPMNGATDVVNANPITITFDEPIRDPDDSDLGNTSIDAKITLKLNNAAGADIPFDATLNGANTTITITPSSPLPDFAVIYVAVNNVEDEFDNAITTAQSVTFTTGDGTPPEITFNPANGATGIPVNTSIVITLNEPIRNTDNSAITDANVASLLALRLNNAGGANVPFTATINAGKTEITIVPDNDLNSDQVYWVRISAVENEYNLASALTTSTFTTVDTQAPVASFNPANGATGVNNAANIVITFNEPIRDLDDTPFTNTTIDSKITLKLTDASGANIPFDATINPGNTAITVNPTGALPDLTLIYVAFNNIEDFSNNQITTAVSSTFTTTDGTPPVVTFNPPDGSTSHAITANIVITFDEPIRNINNSDITNANVASLITFQRTSNGNNIAFTATINAGKTQITIDPTSNLSANVEYIVILASVEDAFNNGTGSRSTTFSTQSLGVNLGPNMSVCTGDPTTITAAITGGNGYYNIEWSSNPPGFSGGSQVITVSPTVTTTYTCIVTDSDGNTNAATPATITLTVNPKPIANFDPATKTSFIVTEAPYQLEGVATEPDGVTPSTGTDVFSGPGVTLHGDGDYYFHPDAAGVQSDIPLTYTHTNLQGCSDSDQILVTVSSQAAVLNLKDAYCSNDPIDFSPAGILAPNPAVVPMANYSHMEFQTEANVPVPNALIETAIPKTYRLDPAAAAAALGLSEVFSIVVYSTTQITLPLVGTITITTIHRVPSRLNRPGPRPGILSFPTSEICSNADPVALTASTDNDGYTSVDYRAYSYPTDIPVSPNPISETQPGEFEYDPGEITYPASAWYSIVRIEYNYLDKNSCAGTVSTYLINYRKPDRPVGIDGTYCQFYEDPLYITATSEFRNLRWYDNQDLNPPILGFGTDFNTGVSSLVPSSKTFYVVDVNASCISDPEPVTVQVTPVPQFNLNIPPQCEGREATFDGPDGADSYNWVLERGGDSGEDVTSDLQNPTHTYAAQGVYQVELTITYTSNNNSCTATNSTQVTVGANPEPFFTYSQLCDGDFTRFVGSATENIGVEQYSWDFGDGQILSAGPSASNVPGGTHGGTTTHTYKDPRHQFVNASVPATYDVTVTAITNLGCFGSFTRPVTVLPYLTADAANPYSMNDIDGGTGFWTTEDINGNSTWIFDIPGKAVIANPLSSWVTGATGTYLPNDRSFVNSPCFNITGFTKPVLALDYITDTQESYDGAVLEYSTDGGNTWTAVGNTSTGYEWFSTQGFITGNIGNSQVGWSGQLFKGEGAPFEWMQGRHKLDDIPNKSKVRFRIAFASNSDGEFEGFAFRNVSIRERNRSILVENFTNSEFGPNNNAYLAISETEAVKMQYHVGYPTDDPEFRVNPTDPAARAAYYGIPLASGYIPRGFVDGVSEGDLTAPWQTQYRDLRSLASAPFLINIDVQSQDGELIVNASADVLQNFTTVDNIRPVMHIAVVEKTAGVHGNVVRKMLPSATGTQIPLPLAEGTTTNVVTARWKVSGSVDRSDLAVVVFIQDEITREVYQAAIEKVVADPGVITDVEEAVSAGFTIFPNPANDELKIQLKEPARTELRIGMNDAVGKEVYRSSFNKGQEQKTLDTSALASGVYFIQVETANGLVRKKIMIVH